MYQKFTLDEVADVATRVYEVIQLQPSQVQIVVLMGSLSTLIKATMESGSVPPGLIELLPILDDNVAAALRVFESHGVNIGEVQ